jgi:hypothetical protein
MPECSIFPVSGLCFLCIIQPGDINPKEFNTPENPNNP